MAQIVSVGFITLFLCLSSEAQIRTSGRIPGYCRPTLEMIIRGQRRVVAVGRTVKPNFCVECKCNPSGNFECCLSKKNAGKVFIFPGSLCTRCKCADLPFTRNLLFPESLLESHCFKGNNLMTCVTSLCVHPLAADPNCIEVKSNRQECCDRCVRSGCYVTMNGTEIEVENNQLAIDNVQIDGVEMIKMNFGDSVQAGCLEGTCMLPDFMFPGGFVFNDASCNGTV